MLEILLESIKAEFQLSDAQLGLLTGSAFGLVRPEAAGTKDRRRAGGSARAACLSF
jgi:hypothetical protein